MQGNRPRTREEPRVRSLTRAAETREGETPDCWHWGLREIISYVENFRVRAIQAYEEEQGTGRERRRFEDLIDIILIPCLREASTYSVGTDGALRTIFVKYHKRKVPINDLYGALGYFISYAENYRTSMETSKAVHICYTRLCYNIGNNIPPRRDAANPVPAVTHMLIVGTFKIYRTEVEGGMTRSHSFSASLPGPSESGYVGMKKESKGIRQERLSNVVGSEATEDYEGHHNFGNCAETLNILSQYPTESDPKYHVVASGHALDVSRVRGEFTSYQELCRRAYKPPCDVCSNLFVNGRITQQDIGSGRISGPFPSNMRMDPEYAARNPPPRRQADMEAPRPQGHGYGEGRYINATVGNPIPPISGYQSHPSAPPYMPQESHRTERGGGEHERGRQSHRNIAGGQGHPGGGYSSAPRGPPVGGNMTDLSRGRSRAPADSIPGPSIPRHHGRAPSSGPRPGPSYSRSGVPPSTTMGGQGQERRREPSVGPRPGPNYSRSGAPPSTTTDRSRPPVTNYNIPLRPRARSRVPRDRHEER